MCVYVVLRCVLMHGVLGGRCALRGHLRGVVRCDRLLAGMCGMINRVVCGCVLYVSQFPQPLSITSNHCPVVLLGTRDAEQRLSDAFR